MIYMKLYNGKEEKDMICKNCGAQNSDEAVFCKKCGAKIENCHANEHNNPYSSATERRDDKIMEQYKPISMWGYFGYEILFSIPIVGLILLLVFSFGGTKNKNLKNFARSYFCFTIVIIFVLLFVIGLMAGSISNFY